MDFELNRGFGQGMDLNWGFPPSDGENQLTSSRYEDRALCPCALNLPCESLSLTAVPDEVDCGHDEGVVKEIPEEIGEMKTFGHYTPLDEMRTFVQASPAELTSPPQMFKVDVDERPNTLKWVTRKNERCVTPEFAPFTGTTPSKAPVKISELFSPVKSPDTRPFVKTPTKVTFKLSHAFEIQTENGEAPQPIIPNKPVTFVPDSQTYLYDDHESVDEDTRADFGQCTSPIRQQDQASGTVQLVFNDTESQTNMSAVHMVDVDSQTGTSYAYLIDASMLTSPAMTADATSLTTPIRLSEQSKQTCMTPMVMVDTSVMMTPTRPIGHQELDMSDQGTEMTPRSDSESFDDQEPVTHDAVVTPVKTAERDTFMTPVTMKDASVLTSPIGNMALRLSDPVLSSLTPLEMRKQLEMALISNELFRTELTGLHVEKTTQSKQMSQQQADIRQKDFEIAQLLEAVEQAKVDTKRSMGIELTSLEGQVKQIQGEMSSAEAKVKAKEDEMMVLKCENNNLQDDLARIYKQHKQEVNDLHADYARKDYKPHFEKAQQVIRKLESEVETYFELMGSMQGADKAQDKLGSAIDDKYQKLKGMEEQMLIERKRLNQQEKEFMEGVATNEMAVRTATNSCQKMKIEVEQMKARLEVADRTINDSQLYQDEIMMELKMATEKLAKITQLFSENKKNLAAANQKIAQLDSVLGEKDEEIVQLEKEKQLLSRECQSQSDLIKKNIPVFPSPETPRNKPRETMDFLEEENHLLADSLKEVEQNVTTAQLELSRSQNQLREKTILCHQLELTVKRLNEKLSALQAELDNTKTNAHFMLLSQGAELADVSVNISMLKDKMTEFQEKLRITAARVLKGVETIPVSQTSAGAGQGQGHSFVSKLLQAADSKEVNQSKHSNGANGSDVAVHQVDSDGSGASTSSEPNNNLKIGSGHSAFAKVTPGGGLSKRGVGVGSENNGSAFTPVSGKRSPCDDGLMNGTQYETQDMSLSTSCAENQEQTIKEELEHVIKVMDVIVELVSGCDQARDRMFHAVKQENQQLLNELELRQSGRTDLQRLKMSVEESERDQIQANVKLLEKAEELEECQAMLEDMRAKCNELSHQIMSHTEQEKLLNKLNEELDVALAEIKHLKSEKTLIEEQLENAMKAMDNDGSWEISPGQYFRDITALRKELHQVKEKFVEKEESYQELKEKASRRMNVLEQNWKLAEDEVFRMDGVIEQIRTTLHTNAAAVKICAPVFGLIKMLDGDDAERSMENSSRENK
ncbi:myosin-11-like isoform X2 [Lineus longissimus]|uniref:myosin-11-like isoform X2 n=1 Tax=Lineus longissimus TaxID=88925 RepID=UPI00315D8ECF